MNTIHQQNNSDRLLGVIRLPIQLSKTVGRGCSGSVCSLPTALRRNLVVEDTRLIANLSTEVYCTNYAITYSG